MPTAIGVFGSWNKSIKRVFLWHSYIFLQNGFPYSAVEIISASYSLYFKSWQLILKRSFPHNDNENNYGFVSKVAFYVHEFIELLFSEIFFNTSFGRKLHYTTKCYIYYICEIKYLNSSRLKQDSPDIERKETGKSLYDLAMDVLILMPLYGLSLKINW